jgi:hypothetical protein
MVADGIKPQMNEDERACLPPLDLQNINILIKLLQLSTLRGGWGETDNLLITVDKLNLKPKKEWGELFCRIVFRTIACISPHSLNGCQNNQLEF